MANEKEKDIHPGAYEKGAGTYNPYSDLER